MPPETGFARRKGYPYRVESPAGLPARLRRLAEAHLPPGETPDTLIVVPQQVVSKKLGGLGGVRSVPEQALVFSGGGLLHVQEDRQPGGPGQAVFLPAGSLIYAHLSLVLLYGRLELCAAGPAGPFSVVVEYNAVNHAAIQPAFHNLLRAACGPPSAEPPALDSTSPGLDPLEQVPLKFRNGLALYALQPGETLLGAVFQPPIQQPFLRVLRRKIAPPALLALTSHQLIWIEEGLTSATSYGWFFTHCPQVCWRGGELRPYRSWLEARIHLERGGQPVDRRLVLDAGTARAWQALCAGTPGWNTPAKL